MDTLCETPDICTDKRPACGVCVSACALFEFQNPADQWRFLPPDRKENFRFAVCLIANEKEPPPEGDGPNSG